MIVNATLKWFGSKMTRIHSTSFHFSADAGYLGPRIEHSIGDLGDCDWIPATQNIHSKRVPKHQRLSHGRIMLESRSRWIMLDPSTTITGWWCVLTTLKHDGLRQWEG